MKRTTIKGAASRRPRAAARTEAQRLATGLASSMRKLHGGRWAVQIDHATRFVLIRQRQPKGGAR